MGFGGLYEPPAPLQTDPARALHCWQFCGCTWRPELLPMYHALHGIPDWESMVFLLETIRGEVSR